MATRLWQLLVLSVLCSAFPSTLQADVIEEPTEQPPPRRRVEPAPPPAPAPAPERAAPVTPAEVEGWTFSVLPYFWWSGVDGHVEFDRPSPLPGIDSTVEGANFYDVFDDEADSAYSGAAWMEARKDRLGIFVHPTYSSLEWDEDFNVDPEAAIDADLWTIEGGLAYTLVEGGPPETPWAFDALVGVRYQNVDIDTDVTANIDDPDHDWVDPFVGARARIGLTEHVGLTVQGDVGGFGVGSDFSWQSMVRLGYLFDMGGMSSEVFIGYRALDVNYERADFEWDLTQHGPLFGLGVHF
jgi:hypothetical protein